MVRFGVIGTNRITEEFIKAGREIADFALTAVYSRTEERACDFADKFNIPNTYTTIESMAESDEVDAIYVASPNSFHAKQAVQCMNKGKHILCEKPIASNTAELREMLAAAGRNCVLLMEAMKSTLLPNFQSVRDNMPKIGQVRRYFASYCQYSSRYDAYKQGTVLNAFNPVFSNGALMDLGIYCIYPMVILFGKPISVQANGVMLDSGVDGEGSILMKYKEMDAIVIYSKITNSHLPSEIQGEQGTLVINRINHMDQVEINYNDGVKEDITKLQEKLSMKYEIQEFIELLNKDALESSTNSFANSLISMEIMDEVRRQIGLVFPADKGVISIDRGNR